MITYWAQDESSLSIRIRYSYELPKLWGKGPHTQLGFAYHLALIAYFIPHDYIPRSGCREKNIQITHVYLTKYLNTCFLQPLDLASNFRSFSSREPFPRLQVPSMTKSKPLILFQMLLNKFLESTKDLRACSYLYCNLCIQDSIVLSLSYSLHRKLQTYCSKNNQCPF